MTSEASGLRRAACAVVGVAESDLGLVPRHMTPSDLMAQATVRALDDCGLELEDIDAVLCAHSQSRVASMQLAE